MSSKTPFSLGTLLSAIAPRDGVRRVSVEDILKQIGDRSFAPAMLVPALILVSPLSAIPGVPTVGALTIILVALQAALGRRQLWLPGFLRRRSISAARLERGLHFLARPARWIDRHSHDRLRVLAEKPLNLVALGVIILTAATWPALELLPMLTSIGAFAVALLATGLMIRDGLFLVAGYVFVGCLVALILRLWIGLV